jgi:hypothetical protein
MRSALKSEDLIRSFLKEKLLIDRKEAQSCIETFYQENEVRRAYRAGLDEQAIKERLAEHFVVTLGDDHFLQTERKRHRKKSVGNSLGLSEPIRIALRNRFFTEYRAIRKTRPQNT